MTTLNTDALREKLKFRVFVGTRPSARGFRNVHKLVNPDGDEAADAIDTLLTEITELRRQVEVMREALGQIAAGETNAEHFFRNRLGSRTRPTWYAVNVLQDYLAASGGTARKALSEISSR